MLPTFRLTTLALALPLLLCAASPAGVEPRRPISSQDVDQADTVVLMLPGRPAPLPHAPIPVPSVQAPVLAPAPRAAAPPPAPVTPAVLQKAPASLATLREPAPPKSPVEEDLPPVLRRIEARLPEEMAKDSAYYLQRRLGVWTEEDARKVLGESARHRFALGPDKGIDGDIYAFPDPSKRHREFELDFDAETGILRSVFVYPWKMKWDDCRKLWGNKVSTSEAANGRIFRSYENRRLDVLVDKSGTVISLGLY